MFHQQRDARLRLVINPDINRVQSGIVKFQLLNVHNEITRPKMHVFRKGHLHRDGREVPHDRTAVRINEVKLQTMFSFISAKKSHA